MGSRKARDGRSNLQQAVASDVRQRFGFRLATGHPGSKPGFRQRERVQVTFPETAQGVPPQHKARRPGLQAVPMRNDVRRAHYQRQNGSARMTPAQRRRLTGKLARQTISKREVTRTSMSVSAIEAGGYRLVPEIGSMTWSKKARDALQPKSRREQAREAAEASRAKRTVPPAPPRRSRRREASS